MKTNQTKPIGTSPLNVRGSMFNVLNLLPLLLALPAMVQAQDYTYTTNDGTITITGYTGSGGAVTIPGTINGLPVTSIGNNAFRYCHTLTGVTIGNSVTSIGAAAFGGCTCLMAITVDTNNPVYSSADGVLFNMSRTTLIQCPAGIPGHYTIPNSVTNIGDDAFSYCTSLTTVTIPNSVTGIGDLAFNYCTTLTAITVDTNNPVYSSVAGVLFDKSRTTLIRCPMDKAGSYTIPNSVTSIGEEAFKDCTSLTSVTIPNSVTSVGGWAFFCCTGLTNVTIPNSVTSIRFDAFNSCTSLTSVTIGNSVTNIEEEAFFYCTRLTSVYFKGKAPSVGSSVFSGNNNATVYYLPGTTGWGPTFGWRPTALWFLPNPLILNSGPSFGVKTNRLGFIISWATNVPVVVEASTDLANPTWSPAATNTLTDGSSYFSDSQWTNYPARFYRLRSL